jgi:chemotaxis protein histidine kinase CheA
MAGLRDLDPSLVRQLLETFRVQMEERLQAITEGLLALERAVGSEARRPLLESMFRAAHNIKGAARGVGLEGSADLAHAVEDLFALWKRGEIEVERAAIDLCLAGLDTLRPLVESEALGQGMDEHSRRLLQALRGAAQGRPPELPAQAAAAPAPAPAAAQAAPGDSVRLPVDRLDRIADLAEELQVAKIRLDDHHNGSRRLRDLAGRLCRLIERLAEPGPGLAQAGTTLAPHDPGSALMADALDLATELDQLAEAQQHNLRASVSLLRPVAGGLRDEARALRMVPAASVLGPLARTVRDLARELGKDARLSLSGEHIEIDRAVLDALRDPLMHLLRNAVDHGIETPSRRRAAGKPEAGQVTVSLVREGGMVEISVSDDGTGIDPEQLHAEALRSGVAGRDELAAMSRQALLDLIFRPGFSTRQQVSTVSGRGVGLDVVRVNLQALHGRVSVESEAGTGTRFRLAVPLTLASEHGLLVRAGGRQFAIPNQFVTRILELSADDIAELEASQVVYLGREPVPLRDLSSLLRLGTTAPPPAGEPIQVVVVNRGWDRVALRVEQVRGEREMVVKPLAPPLARARFFAGGTLGREGDIVLVLEVADLIAAALSPASAGRVVERPREQRGVPQRRILVVDDSITTRTLEESILSSAGYRVAVAADGETAWDKLRHETFDLVISDVEMPGMDGFELTRRIKQDDRLGHLPVIIVTSLGSEEDRRRGMEARADAYIVKSSFESTELLEMVGQLL